MLLVMTAAVAACIAGCSKEDIEAAREAGLHLVAIVPPNASDAVSYTHLTLPTTPYV